MTAATAGVDHVVIAVDDLDAAIARWHTAGFDVHPAGRHATGTHNALMRGPQRAYLELISAVDGSNDPTAARVRHSPGPISWAVGVADLERVSALLAQRGFAHLGPAGISGGGRVAPSGERYSWRILELADRPLDSYLPFLIQWTKPMRPVAGMFKIVNVSIELPDPDMIMQVLGVCGLIRTSSYQLTDGLVGVTVTQGDRGLVAITAAGIPPGSQVLDGLSIVAAVD